MHQFLDKRFDLDIKWRPPISLEEPQDFRKITCDETYFYKILGKHGDHYRLFYIGKCFRQFATTRIFQKDHKAKQAAFRDEHKRHKLFVSFGDVKGKPDDTQINNVESLLIYSHTHDDFAYIKNKQCRLSHNVIKNYRITNKGWMKDEMYKVVAYGLFVR